MKKQILHVKRIDSMHTETLIKDINNMGQSEWRKQVNELAEEVNIKIQMPVLTKNSLKILLQEEINSKLMDEIERRTKRQDTNASTNKKQHKKLIQEEINSKLMDEIERETEKTKIKHWREKKTDIKVGKRPQYMEKLTRKQCNIILKARAFVLPVKNNFKSGCKKDIQCRYYNTEVETQEHILMCGKNS